MAKVVFISGSTDGIGLQTAKAVVAQGHTVLVHGRSAEKLKRVVDELSEVDGGGAVEGYLADLSLFEEVDRLGAALSERTDPLDALINNAGVYNAADPVTPSGLDVRFMVNTIAPYRLTRLVMPGMTPAGRIVNLSSAAQASVDLDALEGRARLSDSAAYAQSKLALTMWSAALGEASGDAGPAVIAVNPGSLLDTRMVREAFGRTRADASVGADILIRASLSEDFADATGRYFDNDTGGFASPHPDAMNPRLRDRVVARIEAILEEKAS